ncbi:HET-domain-containing protein [Stipitochalara longipes BDJ]|nr:HET-domain-containing protein [Stipitochalara longipes BDJ]
MSHVPFIVGDKNPPARSNIEDVRRNLPQGWHADETLEGRLLFTQYDYGLHEWVSTWESPNANKSRDLSPNPSEILNETHEPTFEALSYTWGSNTKSAVAYVMNQERTSSEDITMEETTELRLDITENLAEALRQLRHVDRPRMLWVDAISINQDDVTERNEQVLRMRDLYKYADRVLVWLGPSLKDSSLALSTLEHIGKQVEMSGTTFFVAPRGDIKWISDSPPLPYNSEVWGSLYDLVTRPWFNRLWVTQEIQLANSQAIIQCGNDKVLWCLLRRGILCLQSKLHGVPKDLSDRLLDVAHLCFPVIGTSLPDLLHRYRRRDCVDPLDRVYGLLGLAPLHSTSNIVPDYSLSTIDAYKSTFLAHASQAQRLEFMDFSNSSGLDREWPSWVPDWSMRHPEGDYHYLGFSSSVDSASCWKYSAPNILEATGVQIGTITQQLVVAGEISSLLSDSGVDNLNLLYPTGESLIDAYVSVRYQNRFKEGLVGSSAFQLITFPEARRMMLEDFYETPHNFHVALDLEQTSERWIIRTAEGYIAMSPKNTEINDIICIILGTNVPIVLRKVTTDSTYKIVGHSYIHGFMYGEALLGPLPKPWVPKKETGLDGKWQPRFYNTETKKVVDLKSDPRLGPVPRDWEQLERDEPQRIQKWKNAATGEIINSDPRLLPHALKERGVNLQTFAIS